MGSLLNCSLFTSSRQVAFTQVSGTASATAETGGGWAALPGLSAAFGSRGRRTSTELYHICFMEEVVNTANVCQALYGKLLSHGCTTMPW